MQSLLDLVVSKPKGAGNCGLAKDHVAAHPPFHNTVTEASEQTLPGSPFAFG